MDFFVPAHGSGSGDPEPPMSADEAPPPPPPPPALPSTSSVDDKRAWLQQHVGLYTMGGEDGGLTGPELEAALGALPLALVPVLFGLTTQLQGAQAHNTELLYDVQKYRADAERLTHERSNLHEKVHVAQQDRAAAVSLLASLRAETAALEKRWGEEKNELNVRLTRMAWKDRTIRAQLSKKDVEYDKLQKQLRLGVSSSSGLGGAPRGGGRVRGMDMTPKATYSAVGGSSAGSTGAGPDEASLLALAAGEQRQALLLEENMELRDTLRALYTEVQALQDQYSHLVEEVEDSKARHADALAKAKGHASGASVACGRFDEESLLVPMRGFEAGAFEMPVEWVSRVVGEELRAHMAELGRRYDRLRFVVMASGEVGGEEEEEPEEVAAAFQDMVEQKKALARELRRTRARLVETEEVVAQQEVIIKGALFEPETKSGTQDRLSQESWAAEDVRMDSHLELEKEEEEEEEAEEVEAAEDENNQEIEETEEEGTLKELAEKLTADLSKLGLNTPAKKQKGGEAARTPLRTLSSAARGKFTANLLSPMLQSRLRHSSSEKGATASASKGTPAGRSSLQAALGLISPIERQGESEHDPPKKHL